MLERPAVMTFGSEELVQSCWREFTLLTPFLGYLQSKQETYWLSFKREGAQLQFAILLVASLCWGEVELEAVSIPDPGDIKLPDLGSWPWSPKQLYKVLRGAWHWEEHLGSKTNFVVGDVEGDEGGEVEGEVEEEEEGEEEEGELEEDDGLEEGDELWANANEKRKNEDSKE